MASASRKLQTLKSTAFILCWRLSFQGPDSKLNDKGNMFPQPCDYQRVSCLQFWTLHFAFYIEFGLGRIIHLAWDFVALSRVCQIKALTMAFQGTWSIHPDEQTCTQAHAHNTNVYTHVYNTVKMWMRLLDYIMLLALLWYHVLSMKLALGEAMWGTCRRLTIVSYNFQQIYNYLKTKSRNKKQKT